MLEKYDKEIEALKQRKAAEISLERDKLLIDNHLCFKKKISVTDYVKGISSKNSFCYKKVQSTANREMIYYQLIPFELTDEEYKEVSQYFLNEEKTSMPVEDYEESQKVSDRISIFAMIELILSLLGGVGASIYFGVTFMSSIMFFIPFIATIFVSFFSYFLLKGFACIISDVSKIKNMFNNRIKGK